MVFFLLDVEIRTITFEETDFASAPKPRLYVVRCFSREKLHNPTRYKQMRAKMKKLLLTQNTHYVTGKIDRLKLRQPEQNIAPSTRTPIHAQSISPGTAVTRGAKRSRSPAEATTSDSSKKRRIQQNSGFFFLHFFSKK